MSEEKDGPTVSQSEEALPSSGAPAVPMQLFSTWEVRKVPANCVSRYSFDHNQANGVNIISVSKVVHTDCDSSGDSTLFCDWAYTSGSGCVDEVSSSLPEVQRDPGPSQRTHRYTTTAHFLSAGVCVCLCVCVCEVLYLKKVVWNLIINHSFANLHKLRTCLLTYM